MADRDAMMMNIANEVHAVRPAWDVSGILAALKKIPADRDPDWIRAAALAASKNRIIRWPAVIPMDGDHWEKTKPRTPQQTLNRGPLCAVCQRTKEVHDRCESLVAPKDRHDFETEPDRQARIRAEHVQRTSGRPDSIPDLLSGLGGWPS